MNTPVSSESKTTGKLPEGGVFALRSLTAFDAAVLPKLSRSSFFMASKPFAPPMLLWPNCIMTDYVNRGCIKRNQINVVG